MESPKFSLRISDERIKFLKESYERLRARAVKLEWSPRHEWFRENNSFGAFLATQAARKTQEDISLHFPVVVPVSKPKGNKAKNRKGRRRN